MTEKKTKATNKSQAFLEGLGIARGVIIGTDKNGNTKTYLMDPTVSDLAIYTKLLDKEISNSLDGVKK